MDNSLIEIIVKSTVDPDWFCDTVLGSPNDRWQSEMLNAVADLDRARMGLPTLYNHELKNRFSVVAFHGPGKTHVMAKLMHWFNFTRKARIPCTAPKENQVKTRLWPEFRKIYNNAPKSYRQHIKIDAMKITWFNDPDWCAMVEAGSQGENLAGVHDDCLLYLIDEASGVMDTMIQAIEGSLASPGSALFMIGNPTKTSGEFYRSHNDVKTMAQYYAKQIKAHESPRVDKKWVEGMVAKYGRTSPIVKVRCFGEFVDTADDQLIPLELIEGLRDEGLSDDIGEHPSIRVSVDVADGGEDETIVIMSRHYNARVQYIKMERHSFPASKAPILSAEAALDMWRRYRCEVDNGDTLVIDGLGVGAGTAGHLILKGYPTAVYKGGAGSDDPNIWRNRRTQSYLTFRDLLQQNRVEFAHDFCSDDDWTDFLAQICTLRVRPGQDRVEDLLTKNDMRRAGIKSPDMPDAIVMALYDGEPDYGADGGGEAAEFELVGDTELSNYDGGLL